MAQLFDALPMGSLTLPHRVVMAPLTRNRAPGALAHAGMARYYAQRADPHSGAALIISEATAISQQGQGYSDVPGIWSEAQVQSWKPVTAAVHAAGGRIFMQLWHVGRVSHVDLQEGGQAPVAPSALTAKTKTVLIGADGPKFVPTSAPRALAIEEMAGIVTDYRHAARNAVAAGFDGVEVHAANGYLIDQFLRSSSNQREDAYGGAVPQRARLLCEVMHAVCEEIGGARCALRLSPVTPANDVFDPEPQKLFSYVAEQLGPLGLAYVHVIEGSTGAERDFKQGDAPFDYAALRQSYRTAGGKAAWMVNNGLDKASAQAALDGGADLVAFGRGFIANPDLTERLRQDAALNPVDRATLYGGGDKGYTDYPYLTQT
jgi:N-ethylmaleimide reductase